LKRDEAGDWLILGKRGRIYATPEGFQIVYFARWGVTEDDGDGPHVEDYLHAKRKLIFCRLAQDGTGEGIFFLDRLPAEAESEVIRDIIGILRRGHRHKSFARVALTELWLPTKVHLLECVLRAWPDRDAEIELPDLFSLRSR
jgi:hypothetical protein